MQVNELEDPTVALRAMERMIVRLRKDLERERGMALRIAQSALRDVVPERRALWRLLVKRLEG